MSLKDKILKIASGIFMGFIVLLIVIAFGMPDFITTSAEAKKNLVARVDDLNIYPYDLGQHKQALINRFGGENFPESFRPFIENQALESAINEKLFFILARQSHLIPQGKARDLVLEKFYRENLSNFFKDGKFDFESFEKTLLRQNRTRVDFDKKLIEQKAMETLDELLRDISFSSKFNQLDELQLQNSKISFKVLVLTQSKKEELALKSIRVTENEILERFQKDYLSKDPKDKLTLTKREAIIKQIKNEKKVDAENKFLQKLNQEKSLSEISKLTGEKIFEMKNISLSDNLDAKKPKDLASLGPLQKALNWPKFILLKNREMMSIIADGNYYFLELVDFSQKKYPELQEIIAKPELQDSLKEELKDKNVNPGELHFNLVYSAMNKLLKQRTNIRYYRQKA